MSIEKIEREFEEWYEINKSKPFSTVSIKLRMLDAWKASRESLVVELPELPSVHDGYTKHEIDFMAYAVDVCKDAIESQGIKVIIK